MKTYKQLEVIFDDGARQTNVGRLAVMADGRTAFEYEDAWITEGFAISPFSLPLEKRVFIPRAEPFGGLFGVFDDSLPDGWGRLLVDRLLKRGHQDPAAFDNLNRLAVVGDAGAGALVYRPVHDLPVAATDDLDLDRLARECGTVLGDGEVATESLDELFRRGGSSGGARPKIFARIEGNDWIIKFPAAGDAKDCGLLEYRYSQCARRCGVTMTETRLFPSQSGPGYFGTRRFDRTNGKRIHTVTVGGLLETSHRIPGLDYIALLRLTQELTRDYGEVEQMFRRMCFNVFAHNRDDHAKNFAFLFDVPSGRWHLAPAYDLTYSTSLNGEHATTINGEGRDPGLDDLLAVAKDAGLAVNAARATANTIRDIVASDLKPGE